MRHRLAFQARTDVRDALGGSVPTWAVVFTVWGKLEPLKSVKRTFAGKREHNVTHLATIRARTDLAIGQRVSFDGRVFQVHGFREAFDVGHRWTLVDLEEGVAS